MQALQAVLLAVDEGGVIPVGEALSFAKERFETGACVLGNVAIEEGVVGEVVDIAGDGGEMGGGVTGGGGGVSGVVVVVVVVEEEKEGEECEGEEKVAVKATDCFSREASGGRERREGQEGHGCVGGR